MRTVLAVLLLAAWAHLGQAAPIVFTVQGTASGTLGASTFTNALTSVVLYGDTNDVLSQAGGVLRINALPPTSTFVTIAGFGTASLLISTNAYRDFNGPSSGARSGIASVAGGSILGVSNDAAFATYDLASQIGPIVGSAAFNNAIAHSTSLGDLRITSVSGNTSFTAVLAPEPSSLLLVGLGVAVAGACKRRGARR